MIKVLKHKPILSFNINSLWQNLKNLIRESKDINIFKIFRKCWQVSSQKSHTTLHSYWRYIRVAISPFLYQCCIFNKASSHLKIFLETHRNVSILIKNQLSHLLFSNFYLFITTKSRSYPEANSTAKKKFDD